MLGLSQGNDICGEIYVILLYGDGILPKEEITYQSCTNARQVMIVSEGTQQHLANICGHLCECQLTCGGLVDEEGFILGSGS